MQHDDMRDWPPHRKVPKTPSGLSERIIHAAIMDLGRTLNETAQKIGWWDEIAGMFAFPRPSMAIAFGIVLGLLVGVQAGDIGSVTTQDWSSFLYVNEGGWL